MSQAPPSLPPRQVTGPQTTLAKALARAFLTRIAPCLIPIPMVFLALDHSKSSVVAVLIASGFVTAVAAIEIPWLARSQRDKQQMRMETMPSGAFFACRAFAAVPASGRIRGVPGLLVLDQEGAGFTPDQTRLIKPFRFGWTKVERISLKPARRPSSMGDLLLARDEHTGLGFRLPAVAFNALAKVLAG